MWLVTCLVKLLSSCYITIFTWMQDDSNLRQPPTQNVSANGKCTYPNVRWPLNIRFLLRRNILLLISHTYYTKHTRFYLPLPITVTVSVFIVSVIIFLQLTSNIPILFTAIPQHITSLNHCTGHTALLKTLHGHFWWDVLACRYDPYWLNATFIFLGLHQYLNP
jgi:hypothetical protein